jgi:exosortase family protein XrtF
MLKSLFQEFKPSILFLGKFLGIYLVANLLYGLYVQSYGPGPDPITDVVTQNSAWVLRTLGTEATAVALEHKPYVLIEFDGREIVSVFEGCNGINVVIIFVAFIVAFSRPSKKWLWFIPLGLVVIHGFNLGRIGLLFYVTQHFPGYLYFTHKYLFTAIIYVAVIILWYFWVTRFHESDKKAD